MIPRKKIQFVIRTLCILYTFGNEGCVSADHIEIRSEDRSGLTDYSTSTNDNGNLDSTVTTDTYPQSDTVVSLSNSIHDNTSPILDTTLTTSEYSQLEATVVYQSLNVDGNTSLDSTEVTHAYSLSETTVEYSNVREIGEETSSPSNTTIWSDGTTELFSCEDVLSSVQNLAVSAVTNTTILITWESVALDDECVIEYNITWYSDIDDSYSQTVNCTELNFTISELTPCKNYTINVVAVGLNNVSNSQTVLGNTTESHISQVRNLTVLSIENGLNVTWNPPQDESCLKSYLVDVMTEDHVILNEGTALPPNTFYAFQNLSACTNYTVRVTPISINSNNGTVTTLNDSETSTSVPGLVRNLVAPTDQITEYSVFLSWLAPILNQNCVKYYNVTTCNDNNCSEANTTGLFYNVTSLSPCLAYSFTVRAVGDVGSSDMESTTVDTSDVVPGAVSNLTAPTKERTGYSVYLTWSAPTLNLNCVQYYNVTICHDNDCMEANTTELFYNVTSLNPCLTYSFTVRAVGDAGSSDEKTTTASTLNITPGELASIVAIPGQFSLLVQWDPPEIGSSCVTGYRVTAWATGATQTTTNTFMTISNLSACTNHTVQITPILTTGGDGLLGTVSNVTEESLTDPPKPEDAEPDVTKSTISIGWFIDRTMNKCELKTVLTICNFTSTEGHGFEQLNQQFEYVISEYDSLNNVTINVTVTNLSPFSSYNCTGAIQNVLGYSESSTTVTATTAEDVPSAPTLRVTDPKSTTFTVQWDEPEYLAGNLIEHEIFLSWKRLFLRPSSCDPGDSTTEETINNIEGSALKYIYLEASAYSQYNASIRAKTNAGWGSYSDDINFETDADVPGTVTSMRYLNTSNSNDPNVLDTFLSWKLPCSLNGKLESFYIHFEGIRDGFDNHTYNEVYDDIANISADEVFTKNFGELKAEHDYTFKISTKVVGVSSPGPPNSHNVTYPAGIPPLPDESYMNKIQLDKYKMKRSSSTVAILLPLFNNTNGDIKYYAVMISETGENEPSSSRFDIQSGNWPNTTSWREAMSHTPIILYQSTPIWWYPDEPKEMFDSGNLKAIKFLLGSDDFCSKLSTVTYCNGPLRPDTQYQVKMRAFTNGGFRDSQPLIIKTKAEFNLGMVIGVVFGILFFGIITTMMLLIRKGVLQTALSNILHPSVQSSPGPDPFTRKKFELHCQELIDHPGKLSNEFQLLQTLSVDLEMSANAAELQANRKKNRYINILPYDISRVKLDVVNSDPNSDYINASLIPGYSGGIEYIACQGPKEETTYDFWRMIYQYNVKIIVMVTQLVEKGKDKCYQYYPNTRENFEHEDIMIRCSTQLDFVFYTQRNITLQKKGGVKRTVTHLHFKEWSDHGVPDDVHSMINFCQIVRKLIYESKGLAVVHCSAGVGRTGTLIAIDILLQQIKDNKKLDVFGTVYKMRQHRMNMVQTESQYAYIYNCTKQALNNPPKHYKTSSAEPVYENVTKKRRDITTDSNTNFGNSAESLKKMSPSLSSNSMEPICEIIMPQRPIYTSQLSTLSLRYSKSSSAINTQVPSNLEIARYGSHEYPIFEPAPDSPLSKANVDMNSFLEIARPIRIETSISRPESINLDETIEQSMYGVRPNY